MKITHLSILAIIVIFGNIIGIRWFLELNQVMKIADSFAYLQMAHHFAEFSREWFGNGWFGWLYSLPIALFWNAFPEPMLAGILVNILFWNLFLLGNYILSRKYLSFPYQATFLGLLSLSPVFFHYRIHILSENIYLAIFVFFIIFLIHFFERPNIWKSIGIGIFLALLYFTRGEAFIYLGSMGLIFLYGIFVKKWILKHAVYFFCTTVFVFGVCVFPYVSYIHGLTGKWWLTNKGSSNLRQAELRGVSKMDDEGFEQAVGELTEDSKYLKAGFAGGLEYFPPEPGSSLTNYLLNHPGKTLKRIFTNQGKLFTKNLEQIILGDAYKLFFVPGSRLFYHNPLFLLVLLTPLFFLGYGIRKMWQKNRDFLITSGSFFVIAGIFFTLFFVLDRYFVIFGSLFILLIVFGIEHFFKKYAKKYLASGVCLLFLGIYTLGMYSYFRTFEQEDELYRVKQTAGIRLQHYDDRIDKKIFERFPIVTYYSDSWQRRLTPYTDSLANLLTFARFHGVEYLIVDSIDFARYRPQLSFLLEESDKKYLWLQKLVEISEYGQRVVIYKILQKK